MVALRILIYSLFINFIPKHSQSWNNRNKGYGALNFVSLYKMISFLSALTYSVLLTVAYLSEQSLGLFESFKHLSCGNNKSVIQHHLLAGVFGIIP